MTPKTQLLYAFCESPFIKGELLGINNVNNDAVSSKILMTNDKMNSKKMLNFDD